MVTLSTGELISLILIAVSLGAFFASFVVLLAINEACEKCKHGEKE